MNSASTHATGYGIASPGGAVTTSRVSWGAIFVGAIIAIALMILLSLLGLGIGAASIDPLSGEGSIQAKAGGSAVYIVFSQLVALGAGGYVAAKMAGVPRLLPSAIHGVAVWAVATIATVWLATGAVGAVVSGGLSMLGSATSAVAKAGAAALPDDLQMPDLSLSGLRLDDFPEPVRQAMRERGITPENADERLRAAVRGVVDEDELENAKAALATALEATLRNPGEADAHLAQLKETLGRQGGLLSEQNRREATQALEQQFGVSPDEARAAWDKVTGRVDQAVQSAQQTVAQARQKSLEAADQAARAASAAAFAAFVASLLGLGAAVGASIAGRPKSLVGADLADHRRG
ncbi:MAG: hypothetical protein AB7P21_19025 [Lautropia sp.]